MRASTLILPLILLCPGLTAQSSSPVTFIILQGKDTVSFEQFTRTGNSVAGVWIANNGQVQVHDYALTLDSAGEALRYDMAVSFPDGAGHLPPTEAKYILEFGADSLTLTTGRANPVTRRIAMLRGTYPAVGWSVLDRELRLTRLRAARADSGDLAFTQISGGRTAPAQVVPVRFVGADSAIVGTTHFKVDPSGHILGWRLASGEEARRVSPMDVKKYEDALIAADAQAEAAARAKLVTLPVATLDRLVGDYPLNANVTLTIARDSNGLTLKAGPRPATPLLAHSPTLFSIGRAVSGQMIEFETDSTGNATALTILAPGGLKQRVPKGAGPALASGSSCAGAPSGEFRWWPGIWNYSTPGYDPAVSTVTVSADGCTFTEEFVDTHQQRQHTTIQYDAQAHRWQRVVVDPFRTYRSAGVFAPDGSIAFYETPGDRETYRPTDADHVHFIGEKSTDGGRTWKVLFDATYTRRH